MVTRIAVIITATLTLLPTRAMAEPAVAHIDMHARAPMILGHDDAGFLELYEFDAWLNETGPSEPHVRRTGAAPYHYTTHDGQMPFDLRPGTYAILLHQPEWFVRAAVVPNIVIKPGKNEPINIMPTLDYACVFGGNMGLWQKPNQPDPWDSGTVFHQTFIAKGVSITHAHYKLAGHDAVQARVSIHEVNGDSPANWKQIGPERIDVKLGKLNDNWVGWRSGEVVTTPGKQYAMRIEGLNPNSNTKIAPLVHRDTIGPGYDNGTAYADGKKQPYDIYGTVSSDDDQTCIPYMRIHDIKPGKLVGSDVWSQTWVAMGKSLAAIDFIVAWAKDQDGVTAKITIHENDPTGKVVGVHKFARTAWWGPGFGFLGAAWQPGEVQLTPGKTYCATFTPAEPSTYYSASDIMHPNNAYDKGMAYRNGKKQPDIDLAMTVMEYRKPAKAPSSQKRQNFKGRNLLTNGDFEQGESNQDTNYDPPGWKRWSKRETAFWYTAFRENESRASRLIGGTINNTAIDGGLVQKVDGLDKNKRYCLSGDIKTNFITDKNYFSAVGFDPTGQTADADAKSIVWRAAGRRGFEWEQVVINNVQPQRATISVWTRATNKKVGRQTFHVDFDNIHLEQTE